MTIHSAAVDHPSRCLFMALTQTYDEARERSRGIRVNTVNPAATETPGLLALHDADHALDDEQFKAQRSQGIPLGRLATTEEVANAALFLASGLSSFTTGAALPIDGGYNQV
jgi:NAD(P)-dependent dehydrogenase (short-subunit alcohol dehydrogenase family)